MLKYQFLQEPFRYIDLSFTRTCSGKGLGSFDDMDELTMFADYRVPQLLRDAGVMVYSDHLAAIVDNCTELLAGSEEETQIRCAHFHIHFFHS